MGQSEEMFATIMRSGDTPVEMILYPGGDHHVAEEGEPSFRIDYVTRLVDWVQQWIGARGERKADPDRETRSSSGETAHA
jgi:dipeptidyl aminopeptidase/acylaminoacyl peptidase